MIEVAGATFLASEVWDSDGAEVVGSTSNDGTYLIVAVLTETRVVVRATLVTEVGVGTTEILGGNHSLVITDELALIDATVIEAGVNEPALMRVEIASAVAPSQPSPVAYRVARHAFAIVTITNPGLGKTLWTMLRECWYRKSGVDGPNIGSVNFGWRIQDATGPGTLDLDVGELTNPLDRHSVNRGSVLLGYNQAFGQALVRTRFYGSYLTTNAFSTLINVVPGDDVGPEAGQMYGCIINGGIIVPQGGGAGGSGFQDVIHASPTFGLAPINVVDFADNFIQAQSANNGVVALGPPVVFSGLLLGLDTFVPWVFLFLQDFDVRDAQENYSAAQLFTLAGSVTARISYTWSPRFVESNRPGKAWDGSDRNAELVSPVVGARVDVELIDVQRLVFVSPGNPTPAPGNYTITVNGTDFTHASPGAESRAAIRDALVTLINAGTEPVTAANASDTNLPGAHLTPDDFDVAFTLNFSAPAGSEFTLRAFETSVSGSPFTTAGDGSIGNIPVEVFFHSTTAGDNLGFDRRLRYTVSAPGYRQVVTRRQLTKRLEEDVHLEPVTAQGQTMVPS